MTTVRWEATLRKDGEADRSILLIDPESGPTLAALGVGLATLSFASMTFTSFVTSLTLPPLCVNLQALLYDGHNRRIESDALSFELWDTLSFYLVKLFKI